MSEVIPITMTQIDWPTYLEVSLTVLGRSPAKELDSAGISLKGPMPFVASLTAFKGLVNIHPHKAISQAGFLADHVSFGFIIMTNNLTPLIETPLSVCLSNEGPAIVTGTLRQWRDVIIESLTNNFKVPTPEYREVLGKVITYLEQIGLVDIFGAYRRKPNGLLEAIR